MRALHDGYGRKSAGDSDSSNRCSFTHIEQNATDAALSDLQRRESNSPSSQTQLSGKLIRRNFTICNNYGRAEFFKRPHYKRRARVAVLVKRGA